MRVRGGRKGEEEEMRVREGRTEGGEGGGGGRHYSGPFVL